MIIAVSGYAGSGKDTFADRLVSAHGFTRLAFADPMREMALAINPIILPWNVSPAGCRYADVVGELGYTEAKARYPEVRAFLQRLGTEAGRKCLGEDVWVDALMRRIHAGLPWADYVITDARFLNEATAVKREHGYVVRVNRPGVGPANPHPSETALDDWPFDLGICNDQTIGALHDWATHAVQTFRAAELVKHNPRAF